MDNINLTTLNWVISLIYRKFDGSVRVLDKNLQTAITVLEVMVSQNKKTPTEKKFPEDV